MESRLRLRSAARTDLQHSPEEVSVLPVGFDSKHRLEDSSEGLALVEGRVPNCSGCRLDELLDLQEMLGVSDSNSLLQGDCPALHVETLIGLEVLWIVLGEDQHFQFQIHPWLSISTDVRL